MRRGFLLALVLCGCTTAILSGQSLEKSEGKFVLQFTRAMKPERAKNTVDFNATGDRDYLIEVDATGFKPNFKVLKPEKEGAKEGANVIAVGKKFGTSLRAELMNPPAGPLQVVVGGEEVYSRGMYRISIYEFKKKK